jgi:hypothetical protein
MAKKVSIFEAKLATLEKSVHDKSARLLKHLLNIEEKGKKDGEERRAVEVAKGEFADYSQVSNDSFGALDDISIRFKYRYDGEYWYREWEIGGIGFTYKPVKHWAVLMDDGDGDEEIREAYTLCMEYFRVLYGFKSRDLYGWFLSRLEQLDIEYRENTRGKLVWNLIYLIVKE